MVYSREEAVARALAATTNVPDTCQLWTRTMFGGPSVGDFDKDNDADAVDGWKQSTHKHPGDRNPPAGVPLSWSGGSKGYGHRAVSLGNRRVRSTDAPVRGRVGTVDLDWFEKNWGLTYLGWSEDISGILIPTKEKEVVMQYTALMKMLRAHGVVCKARHQWGSARISAYKTRRKTHPMPAGPADYHFLHVTVTEDTDTIPEGAEGARFVESLGYSTPPMVSYQDLVTNEGVYFQGQDYGVKGTHTVNDKAVRGYPENLNYHGYATALMQNVWDEVTDEQVRLCAMICAAREILGWVKKGAPVLPHRMFAAKSCPGDKAVARIAEIERLKNEYVANGLPQLKPKKTTTRGEMVDTALTALNKATAPSGSYREKMLKQAKKKLTNIKPF